MNPANNTADMTILPAPVFLVSPSSGSAERRLMVALRAE